MDNHKYQRGSSKDMRGHNPANRVIFGLVVVVVGVLLFLKTMGIMPFSFRLSWPIILVVVGGLIGLKSGFRNNVWWILIAIGVAHLIPQFQIMGKPSRHFVWPALVIVAGIMIAFKPRRNNCGSKAKISSHFTDDNKLFVDVTFGGRKEIITAKDFRGGAVSVTFGGSEINLAQADFVEDSIVLDCNVSFGGVELVIPAHWEIQNEIKPVFGSVEDKRVVHSSGREEKKRLILRGNCTFGGIEIKSY